ncbi:hypothetical protein JKP88DRAFT_274853 [Tribonema minus]|uniref:Uncharacterized protein n=1 Tax=Tribonema minus TaxID=303371 RepID=A0A835ZJF1_9STRA|nr:hypothetical protein JKP88DRAFT_274853 [Tribonema minus]
MTLQDNANMILQAAREEAACRMRSRRSSSVSSAASSINPGTKYQVWAEDLKDELKKHKRRASRQLTRIRDTYPLSRLLSYVFAMLFVLFLLVRAEAMAAVAAAAAAVAAAQQAVPAAPAAPVVIVDAAAEIERSKRSCSASRGEASMAAKALCSNLCARARFSGSKPLAHRACMVGCEGGSMAGWDAGCGSGPASASETQVVCKQASARLDCRGTVCSAFRNAYPRPAVINQCTSGCAEAAFQGCSRAKDFFGNK